MAPKTIDYSNTSIYKIQHEDNQELLYVGHTTDFIRRKQYHRSSCNNINSKVYNRKLYQMIRDNGNWNSFRMIEIKKYPCNNANEATAEEDRIMRELKANMNSRRPPTGLTTKEYYKQWRDDNPDYGKKWRDDNPDYNKQYCIENTDKIKENKKQYYINNRAKIRERNQIKTTCDCGAVVCKYNLARHLDTGKHYRWVQNNIE